MGHRQGVRPTTAVVALLAALGLATTACSGAASGAKETVTVGSTVVVSPGDQSVSVSAVAQSTPASSAAVAQSTSASPASVHAAPGSSGATQSTPTSSPALKSTLALSGPVSAGAAASTTASTLPGESASAIGLPAEISASPAFGSDTVAPAEPVKISVAQGKITGLTLTSPGGRVLEGTFSADGTSWSSGEVLGFGKTYTASGTATGTDGRVVPIEGSFTTAVAAETVRTTISPGDGEVVGVASPVIVAFGKEPTDRAAVAKSISITTTPKVTGAWVWIQHDPGQWALDFRPATYWPANTKVHVEAKVYGVDFGDSAYGSGDVTSDFTIGRNQVVKADVNAHFLRVFSDGKQVASYPASYGKGDTPDKITRSGIHVVNSKFPTKRMNNPRYGYVNLLERWAVRISNNGEFIHANPKTVADQGKLNVSHGCVNLSLKDAEAYFKSSLIGDPVEVTGTRISLSPKDGDVFDWTYSWDQWTNLAAKLY